MKRALFPLVLCCACTKLGPMPATTGISAAPIGRPGMEAQFAAVPGFYASRSAANTAHSETMSAGTVLVDLDRWLPMKGVIVGGRLFGKEDDTPLEPFVGYRRELAEGIAIGGVVFGSTNRAGSLTAAPGATYHGVRFGGEAMADFEVWVPNPWFRIRAQAALSATRILASGTYCVDDMGIGIDCDEPPAMNMVISGKFVGVYGAGTGSLALDMGRHQGVVNSVRVALLGTVGQMPLVVAGKETGTDGYFQLGISLAFTFGLGRATAQPSE